MNAPRILILVLLFKAALSAQPPDGWSSGPGDLFVGQIHVNSSTFKNEVQAATAEILSFQKNLVLPSSTTQFILAVYLYDQNTGQTSLSPVYLALNARLDINSSQSYLS